MQKFHDIGNLLQRTAGLLARQSDQILQSRLSIGMSQYRILKCLQGNSGLQQQHVAGALGQTEASISRQIKLLEKASLLAVRINPNNKRQHLITLTAKGVKMIGPAQNILDQYHSKVFSVLNKKQQAETVKALEAVQKYLKTAPKL